jgi:hypothetical protein
VRRDGFISWRVFCGAECMQQPPGSITGRLDKPQCRRWLDEEAEFVAETETSTDQLRLPVKSVASTEKFARSSRLLICKASFLPF